MLTESSIWKIKQDSGFGAQINRSLLYEAFQHNGQALQFHSANKASCPPLAPNTMGGRLSTVDRVSKKRSDEIDQMIEEDKLRFKTEHRILVLGSRESGKSTILKQMKIIHEDGFSKAELAKYTPTIYKNILESAQSLIVFMKKIGVECEQNSNKGLVGDKVLEFKFDESDDLYFPPKIAEYIHQLWKDPVVQKILDEHASDFHIMDSAAYFFDEVRRIGAPEYLPTATDVLRARVKPKGIQEIRFNMGPFSIHMFELRGQSERRKWIHFFDSVTSILFCMALTEYDQVLLEDSNQTQLNESLALFESVVNSRWFLRTSIILFLNKIDVFKVKLLKVPLERYFPEYTGGPDIDKAAKYILWKFKKANRARLSVYPHLTQATDGTNLRLVFLAVRETVLQNVLKDSGVL